MGWGSRFLGWIAGDRLTPGYLLRSVKVGTFNAAGGDSLKLSSFRATGYRNIITAEGSAVSYGTLTPGTWTRTYGTLTLGVTEDVRHDVTRGQVVQLSVGKLGWDLAWYEPVWLGVVRNVRYVDGHWTIECVELAGALQNRFSSEADEQNLFFNLPSSTKLTADYDPVVDDPTNGLFVADAQGLEHNNQGNYCVRLTPSDGPEYYVTADTRALLHLTGTAAGAFDSPIVGRRTPHVGTPVAAVSDDPAEAIAWIRAHPIYLALRVLCSTGTATPGSQGTNGPDDLLPAESWGYGIPYGLVDRDDALAFKELAEPESPAPEHWDFLVDHSQSDGVTWLAELLRPGGFFVSQHQGRLTVRAVVTPANVLTPGHVFLGDDDIAQGGLEYEAWDSSSPVEYRKVRVLAYLNADPFAVTEPNLASRPTRVSRRHDLLSAFSDVSAGWTEEVASRLVRYDTRVPERLTVTTIGWAAAVASMGDIVLLSTGQIGSRDDVDDPAFRGTPCLMVGGGPDWFGSTCTLEMLHVSASGTLN